MSGYEFDPAKDAANVAKHGVGLGFGRRIFDDLNHIIVATFRSEDAESRRKAVGIVDGKLYTAVHVWRGPLVRMISVRRSNDLERRQYDRNSG